MRQRLSCEPGSKHGLLTILKYWVDDKTKNTLCECNCDCGNNSVISKLSPILRGNKNSCGCLHDIKGPRNGCFRGYGEMSATFWGDIKYKAKLRNLDFKITMEYAWGLFLQQDRKCSISGLPIAFPIVASKSDSRYFEKTASLDRIDNNLGYIEGNIQWTHKAVNMGRGSLTVEEFIYWCSLVADNN